MDEHIRIIGPVPGGSRYVVDGVTYELPSRFDFTATDVPGLEVDVEASVVMYRGRPHAERVCLLHRTDDRGRPAGPYVTGTAFRALALQDLMERAVRKAASVNERPRQDSQRRSRSGSLRGATDEERRAFGEHYDKRRQVSMTKPEKLAAVAEVYRRAHLLGASPTAAVQDAFDIARSTAGRWVQQAREQGHLGPAPGPRQAGEVTDREDGQ